ncbi:MAG: hypothetical protein QG627_705 [Chlamydiota bacterium]|jgi:hypothetical protein|nr:hypothetical protein [Chlamydiota bacterium]
MRFSLYKKNSNSTKKSNFIRGFIKVAPQSSVQEAHGLTQLVDLEIQSVM